MQKIKPLVKHRRKNHAIVVDKALLEAGSILEKASDVTNVEIFRKSFKKLNKKYSKLMKKLTDL